AVVLEPFHRKALSQVLDNKTMKVVFQVRIIDAVQYFEHIENAMLLEHPQKFSHFFIMGFGREIEHDRLHLFFHYRLGYGGMNNSSILQLVYFLMSDPFM